MIYAKRPVTRQEWHAELSGLIRDIPDNVRELFRVEWSTLRDLGYIPQDAVKFQLEDAKKHHQEVLRQKRKEAQEQEEAWRQVEIQERLTVSPGRRAAMLERMAAEKAALKMELEEARIERQKQHARLHQLTETQPAF